MDSEINAFVRSIALTVDRLLETLAPLGDTELNWRPPASAANSLFGLTSHALGAIEQRLVGTIGDRPVERDREAELAGRGGAAALRERWLDILGRAEQALDSVPNSALDRVFPHENLGEMTGRELLHHVVRHTAEHYGEAQLTLAWQRSVDAFREA